MARSVAVVAIVLALLGSAMSFQMGGPIARVGLGHSTGLACRRCSGSPIALRRASAGRAALRMADAPSTDSGNEIKEEEAPVPSTVLSDDDLDARIAALGLKAGAPVQDRSTGEDMKATMSPLKRVQEESVSLGKAAIGGTASGLISVLNSIEKPIDEEDWKKLQEERNKAKNEVKEDDGSSLITSGGIFVLIPAVLVGGALAYWAIASELNLF